MVDIDGSKSPDQFLFELEAERDLPSTRRDIESVLDRLDVQGDTIREKLDELEQRVITLREGQQEIHTRTTTVVLLAWGVVIVVILMVFW
jgi:hypothetical protein